MRPVWLPRHAVSISPHMELPPRRRRDIRTEKAKAVLTERHRDLFRLLDPTFDFKYLTSKWAHEFIGGNEHAFKVMLRNLFDAGYLDRPRQQAYSPNSNSKHLVYERTDKAVRALGEGFNRHALSHRSNSYPHEFLVDLGFYAPMRYAVKHDPALELYGPRSLLSGYTVNVQRRSRSGRITGAMSMQFPLSTREDDDPFLITLQGGETMRFDGTPFVLERKLSDGSTSVIFVPGIEVDRKTEGLRSVNPKNPARTTLTRHIVQIAQFFRERAFMRHYGFHMMMVPIITTNETHTRNAMAFVEQEIGPCKYLLFKTLPDLALEPHFPKPSADFFATPWMRVGHRPFNLATFEEV
jgi:hypothetical protein